MSVITILECDGCGKRAEYKPGVETAIASKFATKKQAENILLRIHLGSSCIHVCSGKCLKKAFDKAVNPQKNR